MSFARLLEDAGPRVAGSDAETAAFDRVQAALESIRARTRSGSDSPVAVGSFARDALRSVRASRSRRGGVARTDDGRRHLTASPCACCRRRPEPRRPRISRRRGVSSGRAVNTVRVHRPADSTTAPTSPIAVEGGARVRRRRGRSPRTPCAPARFIVAFNSAEEDGFMGAHGIATGHLGFRRRGTLRSVSDPWASAVPIACSKPRRGGASDRARSPCGCRTRAASDGNRGRVRHLRRGVDQVRHRSSRLQRRRRRARVRFRVPRAHRGVPHPPRSTRARAGRKSPGVRR